MNLSGQGTSAPLSDRCSISCRTLSRHRSIFSRRNWSSKTNKHLDAQYMGIWWHLMASFRIRCSRWGGCDGLIYNLILVYIPTLSHMLGACVMLHWNLQLGRGKSSCAASSSCLRAFPVDPVVIQAERHLFPMRLATASLQRQRAARQLSRQAGKRWCCSWKVIGRIKFASLARLW